MSCEALATCTSDNVTGLNPCATAKIVYVPGSMRAIKLQSADERTCLRIFDALKIATVASAIGLPPSSRTIPLIVPRFEVTPTAALVLSGVDAYTDDIVAIKMMIRLKMILERLKPIKYERAMTKKNLSGIGKRKHWNK